MGRPRRSRASVKSENTRASGEGEQQSTAKSGDRDGGANEDHVETSDSSDADVPFDPGKLSIVISGVSKPFSAWTREYACHYYPELGHRTYRVPPVDFNTQELKDVTHLGYSELAKQKEENRKKDRSQADVAMILEELGRQLEEMADGGGGLFIIANAHYDNYLSDLKGLAVKGKQPPLPGEVTSRGEVDLLVLHPQKGILLIQIKGVGFKSGSWEPTEQQLCQAVQKKLKEAVEQVRRDHVVLNHVMQDLQLQCVIHRVVALPFVSRQRLEKSLNGFSIAETDGNQTEFLCMDDLVDTGSVLAWWAKLAMADKFSDLTIDQLQSIVGRYCGLLSTVQVWAKSSLRVEVRDVAEAASEVGSRFASIVLTPEQRTVLDCQTPYAYLHGPPGSGKSVMLVVKARQWVLGGSDVCILNVDYGKQGMPIGHYIHDSILQWKDKRQGKNAGDGKGKGKKGQKTNGSNNSRAKNTKNDVVDDPTASSVGIVTSSTTSVSKKSDHTSTADNESSVQCASPPAKKNPVTSVSWTTADTDSIPSSSPKSYISDTISSPPCKSSAGSRVFRVDFDMEKHTAVEDIMNIIQNQVRPGIPCHFLCDEFYWKEKLNPLVEAIRADYPDSCIWCAEISREKAPNDFILMPLKTVLRCPPTVQAILQRTDWLKENRALYTVDSTQHGLPTDGLKPRLLEHQYHLASSPLDCRQCADLFIYFLRHDLKLSWHETERAASVEGNIEKRQSYSVVRGVGDVGVCSTGESSSEQSNCILSEAEAGENKETLDETAMFKAREMLSDCNAIVKGQDEISTPVKKAKKKSSKKKAKTQGHVDISNTLAAKSSQEPSTISSTHTTAEEDPKPKTANKAKNNVSALTSPPVPKTKKKGHLMPSKVKFSDVVVLFSYPRKCLNPGNMLIVKAQLQDLHHATIQSSVFYQRVLEAGVPATFLAPNADARDIALPARDQVMFSVTNAVTGLERKVVVYIPCESMAYPEYPLDLSRIPVLQVHVTHPDEERNSKGGTSKQQQTFGETDLKGRDKQDREHSENPVQGNKSSSMPKAIAAVPENGRCLPKDTLNAENDKCSNAGAIPKAIPQAQHQVQGCSADTNGPKGAEGRHHGATLPSSRVPLYLDFTNCVHSSRPEAPETAPADSQSVPRHTDHNGDLPRSATRKLTPVSKYNRAEIGSSGPAHDYARACCGRNRPEGVSSTGIRSRTHMECAHTDVSNGSHNAGQLSGDFWIQENGESGMACSKGPKSTAGLSDSEGSQYQAGSCHISCTSHPSSETCLDLQEEDGSPAEVGLGTHEDGETRTAEASPSGPGLRWQAGLSEEDWRKVDERMVQQNKMGMFYAASRCLSVFVLIIP